MFLSSTAAVQRPSVSQGMSAEGETLVAAWQSLQPSLVEEWGEENHAAWLAPLRVINATAQNLTLGAPTTFLSQWVHTNYLPRLEELLSIQLGQPISITLQVVPNFNHFAAPAPSRPALVPVTGGAQPAAVPAKPVVAAAAPTAEAQPEWLQGSRLDSRYTFDQFITGKSNTFAFTAAQSVAENLAKGTIAYNPFFLHGGVGLGKTHLMQAIGHTLLQSRPNVNVLYLSAEQFLYKFIRALKDKNTLGFKELFRTVDVLMIDDIQFIAGKDATQEEFFHTFNTLMQEGKQIILTADRSPHELANIEDRLKSRLGSGLTVEMHVPDEETRHAILQQKAEVLGVGITPEVLQLLASHIASNVRELEGALNRLVAYARLTGETLTPELAREQLRDLFRVYTRVITIDDIQQKVAAQFNIRVSDMHSPRRAREVARPRQVAMYLAKQLTSKSYPDIGRAFGGRDHTTVIHACETIVSLIPRDAQLAEQIQLVTRTLQGR